MHKLLRRLWRRQRTQLGLIVVGTVIGLSALTYGLGAHPASLKATTAHPQPGSQHARHLKPPKAAAKPAPKPAPTTASVTTPATAKATAPAPKPATNVAQSPAAVASTGTSPGSGVSGLSPTDSSTPATPPTSTASTGTTGTSSPPASCTNTPGSYASTNWSGYFRSGCTFTAVSGAWTVPAPTTTSTTVVTADAAWIGIGGVSTDDLIQVGTEETVDTDGTINAAVFYELLPDAPHYPVTITVTPGDHMSAALNETTAGQWLISITDTTTGTTYTKSVAYTSTHSSAEWIEEDPSYSDGSLVPFDDFGTVNFSAASSTGNGVTGSLADASDITLVDDQGRALALPSAVTGAANDAFSVVRRHP